MNKELELSTNAWLPITGTKPLNSDKTIATTTPAHINAINTCKCVDTHVNVMCLNKTSNHCIAKPVDS